MGGNPLLIPSRGVGVDRILGANPSLIPNRDVGVDRVACE